MFSLQKKKLSIPGERMLSSTGQRMLEDILQGK